MRRCQALAYGSLRIVRKRRNAENAPSKSIFDITLALNAMVRYRGPWSGMFDLVIRMVKSLGNWTHHHILGECSLHSLL